MQHKTGEWTPGFLANPTHFALLIVATAALVTTNRWYAASGLVIKFGLYGVLHASVLAASARASLPFWRKLLFVALSGLLSMLCVELGLRAGGLTVGLPPASAGALSLCLASGLGAAGYAMLIRCFTGALPSRRAVVVITLGCMVVTELIAWSGFLATMGSISLAVGWWFAFSAGLWYDDAHSRGCHSSWR